MRKGQISIELIILLAVFLLFLHAMIIPTIEFSENILKDTHAIITTKKSVDHLATHIEQFAIQDGYGTRKVYLYLPTNATVSCIDKKINYKIYISTQQPIPLQCDENGICDFNRELYISGTLTCPTKIGPGYKGPIAITKAQTNNMSIRVN